MHLLSLSCPNLVITGEEFVNLTEEAYSFASNKFFLTCTKKYIL
jgi:hypothetical protein